MTKTNLEPEVLRLTPSDPPSQGTTAAGEQFRFLYFFVVTRASPAQPSPAQPSPVWRRHCRSAPIRLRPVAAVTSHQPATANTPPLGGGQHRSLHEAEWDSLD